ncbi:hypothetical protein HXZ91_05005 [Myroides odoratimimus]|uniref:hypothetical protein n=1 Tax=Myroides odoratimimus TaxID=76832 RepID=UPI002576C31A|nr:hypothetical protein [Myroides odoratimimus]MDM1033838.1 hypothetical protein [Myroides odoratimimus]
MKHLIESLDQAVHDENWYSALFFLVTIPDICSKLEFPKQRSTKLRYSDWIENYLYKVDPDYEKHICGVDFYALRCSLLHEGNSDIEGQTAARRIEHIRFLKNTSHLATIKDSYSKSDLDGKHILVLSVKQLSSDIIQAYHLWIAYFSKNPEFENRMCKSVKIEDFVSICGVVLR